MRLDISTDYKDQHMELERPFMRLDIREAVPLSIGMELRGKAIKVAIERATIYPYEVDFFRKNKHLSYNLDKNTNLHNGEQSAVF